MKATGCSYRTTSLILVLLFHIAGVAQDRKLEIPLDRYEAILDRIFVPAHGFIVEVGMPFLGVKGNNKIHYYSTTGELIWEKKVRNYYGHSTRKAALVASEDGAFVYSVEQHKEGYNSMTHFITQIARDGVVKNHEMEGTQDMGSCLQAVFCDSRYLYYLASALAARQHKKTEEFVLTRIDATNFSSRQFVINLPGNTGNAIHWSFAGQKGSEKFLAGKSVDATAAESSVYLVAFNEEGEVVRKSRMDISLDGDNFFRPAYAALAHNREFHKAVDNDFKTIVTKSRTRHIVMAGAFNHVYVDAAGSACYVFGLMGPNPFKKGSAKYHGAYVFKYDLQGKLLWKMQESVLPAMQENIFRVSGAPADRRVGLNAMHDGHLNFTVNFGTTEHIYEISQAGALEASFYRKDMMQQVAPFMQPASLPGATEGPVKTLYSPDASHTVHYSSFSTSSGEVVLHVGAAAERVDIFYFKSLPGKQPDRLISPF